MRVVVSGVVLRGQIALVLKPENECHIDAIGSTYGIKRGQIALVLKPEIAGVGIGGVMRMRVGGAECSY